jgi:hypothetical protein
MKRPELDTKISSGYEAYLLYANRLENYCDYLERKLDFLSPKTAIPDVQEPHKLDTLRKLIQELLHENDDAAKFNLYCNKCTVKLGIEDMIAIERLVGKVEAFCSKCGTTLKYLTKKEQGLFSSPNCDGDGYIG